MTGTPPVDGNPGGNTPPATPWHNGFEPELLGYMQGRGLDKLDPVEAFKATAKAHREAAALIGHPQDLVLKLPKDASDEAGWAAVRQRLGAPDKPEGYEFDATLPDPDVTAKLIDTMRGSAAKYGLSKDAAAGVARDVFKAISDFATADDAEMTAKLAESKAELIKSWGPEDGPQFRANSFVADQGAKAIGAKMGNPEMFAQAVEALRDQVGGAAVLEMFLAIGNGLGEGRYVANSNGDGQGAMSREQAVARKAELMGNGTAQNPGDKAWQDRYFKGGSAERRELAALNAIILG